MSRNNHKNRQKIDQNLINNCINRVRSGIELTVENDNNDDDFVAEYCIDCGSKLEFLSDKFIDTQLITELFEKFICPKCGYEYEFDYKVTKNH